jgi:hypothetical protein
MIVVSLSEFLLDRWLLAAIGLDGVHIDLQRRDIELGIEFEALIECEPIEAFDDVAVDFFAVDDGLLLNLFQELRRAQHHLSEKQGIALLGVGDEAGDELRDPHLPQRIVVEPHVIVALYPHMEDLLHIRSHLAHADLLLLHLDQVDPVEVLMQLELAYPLAVQHLLVVQNQDLMVAVYVSHVFYLPLQLSHLLVLV